MPTESGKVGAATPPTTVTQRKPKKSQSPKSLDNAARTVTLPSDRPLLLSKPTGTSRTIFPLPAKSVEKAAKAFSGFSLSRFAKGTMPPNYVSHTQAKNPSAVSAAQHKSIARQKAALEANPPKSLGLTLALPSAKLAQFLPSLDEKKGTVDLAELLGVLQQNLQGTHFYASGNPTLNRVVQDASLLSQVQAYIQAIKAGGPANVGAAVNQRAAAGQQTPAKGVAGRRVATPIRKGEVRK